MSDLSIQKIMFSKQHMEHPLSMSVAGHPKISVSDQKAKIIGLSIAVGFLTVGIGGVVCFYYLTAKQKFKKIDALPKEPTNVGEKKDAATKVDEAAQSRNLVPSRSSNEDEVSSEEAAQMQKRTAEDVARKKALEKALQDTADATTPPKTPKKTHASKKVKASENAPPPNVILHSKLIGPTEITIKRGQIVNEKVDAIVNAANEKLEGGGGVNGQIHKSGGSAILQECLALPIRDGDGKQVVTAPRKCKGGEFRCAAGDAFITGAGNLKAKHVIHAVGPRVKDADQLTDEPQKLADAYTRSLQLALDKNCKSITFCLLSTSIFGYPAEKAMPVAMKAVCEFVEKNPHLEKVNFIIWDGSKTFNEEVAICKDALDHQISQMPGADSESTQSL